MRNFLLLLLLERLAVKSHNDIETSNEGAFYSKAFPFIEAAVAFAVLTFNDKFLHRPENDQRTPNLSQKLTRLAQNLPHFAFLSILSAAMFSEKSQKHCADIPELHM